MKRLLFALVGLSAMTVLSACDAYVYDDGHWHNHRRYHPVPGPVYYPPYRPAPPIYRPHPPIYRPVPAHPIPRPYRGGGRHHVGIDANLLTAPRNAQEALADDYDIKVASALKLIHFAGGKQHAKALNALGVTALDMAPLTKPAVPSREAIDKMAARLGEDPAKLERVLTDFVSDIRAKK